MGERLSEYAYLPAADAEPRDPARTTRRRSSMASRVSASSGNGRGESDAWTQYAAGEIGRDTGTALRHGIRWYVSESDDEFAEPRDIQQSAIAAGAHGCTGSCRGV